MHNNIKIIQQNIIKIVGKCNMTVLNCYLEYSLLLNIVKENVIQFNLIYLFLIFQVSQPNDCREYL